MSIVSPEPSRKTDIPACTSYGCPEPGTISGVYDDGDERSRVNYCPECAGYLHREFTPISSTTFDLRGLVVQALPLPGETMTAEAYERIVNDLLLRPRGDA